MGNRATVIFTDKDEKDVGPAVYLHWNGGPESVYAFLAEMDRRKVRTSDVQYETARFIHIVGDFFDQDEASALSLGVSNGPRTIAPHALKCHDPGDNGIYVVARNDDGEPHVRRFGCANYDSPLEERGGEYVARERSRALAHKYNKPADGNDSLADTFKKLRPKVERA